MRSPNADPACGDRRRSAHAEPDADADAYADARARWGALAPHRASSIYMYVYKKEIRDMTPTDAEVADFLLEMPHDHAMFR